MKSLLPIPFAICALMLTVSCASTKVTGGESEIGTGQLAKPARIYVYPFTASHAELPRWSTAGDRLTHPNKPPTPEELEVGRHLGTLVAKELVTKIVEMGLVALEGTPDSLPQPNDLMIIGYFGVIEEGSTAKRLTIGFGSGGAELTTAVEGYQMTKTGPRLLGADQLDSGGGKVPGVILPVAIFAATHNPIGLAVMGAVKLQGELSGRSKIEGSAKRTAETIAEDLRRQFKAQGWI